MRSDYREKNSQERGFLSRKNIYIERKYSNLCQDGANALIFSKTILKSSH